jgi:subtilase-type serine protease
VSLRIRAALGMAALSLSSGALAVPGDFLFDPSRFVDAEFLRSGALAPIGAQYAYARGHTGKGVLVAVLDSGLYARHPEFAGRVAGGWNFEEDQSPEDYSDTELDDNTGRIQGHGTHVAGIIAANRDGVRMHGVAFDARLLAVRTDFDTDWDAIDYAIAQGAQVLNGSYGPDATPPLLLPDGNLNPGYIDNVTAHPELLQHQMVPYGDLSRQVAALRRAAAADVLMVFAAGNDYREYVSQASHVSGYGMYHLISPSYWNRPGLDPMFRLLDEEATENAFDPATYVTIDWTDARAQALDLSDLGGSMLSVVAVAPSGTIASYSNRCGDAWLYCVAAPGGDMSAEPGTDAIYSTNPDPANGYYVPMNGTSMAAPVVSGAAAVLRGAFPFLSARQVIEVILTTTQNQGPYADQAIYGRGLLDLGAAVRGPGAFGADGFPSVFRVDTKGHDAVFGNDIGGPGGLVKTGAGTLTLSGTSTYAGATLIEGGRLAVDGDTSTSALTVGPQGTLGGHGRTGDTEVFGRVAPGNSIGTLTVAGNYVQHAGSVLEIEIDGAGGADRLEVQGNADLQGGEVRVLGLRGGSLGRSLAFLDVQGALSGSGFSGVRNDYVFAALGLDATGPGQMSLTVSRNQTGFASLARTDNQRRAAGAIESLGAGAAPYEALIDLRDAAQAPGLYDQLSGEIHATTASMAFEDGRLVRQTALDHLRVEGTRRGFWGQGLAAWSRHGGAGVAQDATRRTTGLLIGHDQAWGDAVRGGLAAGYTRSRVRAEGDNEATLDGYHVLAYGGWTSGPWQLRGGLSQTWLVTDTRREVEVAQLGRQTARYDGWMTQLYGELGYEIPWAGGGLEPYAGISQAWQRTQAFAEDGSAPLSGQAAHSSATDTELGLRAAWRLDTGAGALTLSAGAGWQHRLGSRSPQLELSYGDGPSAGLAGVPAPRDALRLTAQSSLVRGRSTAFVFGYDGRLGSGLQEHSVSLQIRHTF